VLRRCEEEAIAIPCDLAVVGYDGFPASIPPQVTLTTVRAPWAEAARTAVGLLEKIRAGQPVLEEVMLPVEFVLGDSA
jgi:DNA-binding LacI/PurR family transcriptional regulator